MIIYLAGKMTGLPDWGREQFHEAERILTERGHIVLNPACLPIGLKHENYMQIGLAMLQAADAIMMLDGWRDSDGAHLELEYAHYQRKLTLEQCKDGVHLLERVPKEEAET